MRGPTSRMNRATGCRRSGRCWTASPRRGRPASRGRRARRPGRRRRRTRRGGERRRHRPIEADSRTRRSRRWSDSFDPTWGGFGGAPKFPQPMVLAWLLRQHVRGTSGRARDGSRTLDRMAHGGIHDQVGGGFARYSTDARWHVPHFEKMLSDNALLLELYTHAWLVTRDDALPRRRDPNRRLPLREMQQPEGGFATSQDADSDGVEGQFFVWDRASSLTAGGRARRRCVRRSDPKRQLGRHERPVAARTLETVAARHGWTEHTCADDRRGRQRLLERRRQRVPPAIDDKVVAGLERARDRRTRVAGRALGVSSAISTPRERGAAFVWASMRDAEGRPATLLADNVEPTWPGSSTITRCSDWDSSRCSRRPASRVVRTRGLARRRDP